MPRANRVAIELNIVQANRFWSNVTGIGREGDHCWLWSGRTDDFGYGHFKNQGHSLKAHRVAWTLKRGPIPTGMTLDHLCRVPQCVKPEHLQLVTNKENILRGISPAAVNAKRTHCKNGHEFTKANTIMQGKSRLCRTCSREWHRLNDSKYRKVQPQER